MAQTQRLGKTATTIGTVDDTTHITYHNTVVVSFNEKQIVLRHGGWRTVTTKTRMNQASNQFGLGYQVSQKDFEWLVTYKGETVAFNQSGEHTILRSNG